MRDEGGLRARWPLASRTDLRDRLLAAYGGPGRGYHDARHLADVLARLAELGAADDAELVLAAWFHDAVHDGEGDDEERSARLAEAELAEAGPAETQPAAADVDADEVARLVRLTRDHRPAPGDRRGELLCDADLAILAAAPERYEEYVAGVRREYAHVPDAAFARGRLAILRALAAKPTLFHSDHAREHWEAPARRNLEREIAALEATTDGSA